MKKTVVIGASPNPERYSNKAVRKLRAYGHEVVAIGRRSAVIGDVQVAGEKIPVENADTVTLYLNPQNQEEYYNYIIDMHPKRIIFNPGTENSELEELAAKNNIETIEACTLVLLSIGDY